MDYLSSPCMQAAARRWCRCNHLPCLVSGWRKLFVKLMFRAEEQNCEERLSRREKAIAFIRK